MSTSAEATPMELEVSAGRWALWRRQAAAIFWIEVRKNTRGPRSIPLYLLAVLPVFIMSCFVITREGSDYLRNPADAANLFGVIYGAFVLRTVVFFGCAWTFMNLIRGEVVDRSLHYFFLTPVRRSVLLVAKFLAGFAATATVFSIMTVTTLALESLPRGAGAVVQQFVSPSGLGTVATYVGITVLGCLGYGAVFIVVGLFFRNPIFPALAVYGWEFTCFLMPPMLKATTVIFYLQSLLPVPISEGPFAVVAEPVSGWLSVPGLVVFTAVILAIASLRFRHMEISYGTE